MTVYTRGSGWGLTGNDCISYLHAPDRTCSWVCLQLKGPQFKVKVQGPRRPETNRSLIGLSIPTTLSACIMIKHARKTIDARNVETEQYFWQYQLANNKQDAVEIVILTKWSRRNCDIKLILYHLNKIRLHPCIPELIWQIYLYYLI